MTPCNAKLPSWKALRLAYLSALLLLLAGCAGQPGVYHTVESGQNLYRISRAYQVDERYLARINGINDPTSLRVGQRLYIPDATRSVAVPKGPGSPPPVAVKAPAADLQPALPAIPTMPQQHLSSGKAAPKPPDMLKPSPSPGTTAILPGPQPGEKGRFQWPLRGTLLRSFGSTGGTLNKGIEIASPIGSAVLSAGAGKVIYSSDGVAGYGNLIIIRHDDGFFSVYGFNKKNLVTVGNFVSKGQRIALSGTPPGGGSPRLHFEIRNGKDAVNPIFYLP